MAGGRVGRRKPLTNEFRDRDRTFNVLSVIGLHHGWERKAPTWRYLKQVAASMGTSEIMVKVHRAQVMEKMGAESLPDLVRMSERLGATPTWQ